mmetsp:Transcript_17097/g.24986  ORF Transcript_17097/g.24986 Transcript_17097/m.24986 type:complete len:297 (-) Transcript_17097:586-1476(-)
MEIFEHLDNFFKFILRRQDGGAEVEGAFFLPKPRPGHPRDPRLVQQLQAVENIGGLPGGSGSLQGLLGQSDLGEGVQGTVNLFARDAGQAVEGLGHHLRPVLQGLQEGSLLLLEQVVRWGTRLGGVDHEPQRNLAGHVGGQVDGGNLVQHARHLGVNVRQLKVTTTQAALAVHTLGHRVEGDQLQLFRVRGSHIHHGLAGGDEHGGALVDVLLVHLVRHQHNVLLYTEAHQLTDALLGEALPGGVAWVDEHQGAHRDALGPGLVQGAVHGVQVDGPPFLLVQVVAHQAALVETNGG